MTTDIPFANPHAAFAERRLEILEAVTRVLDGGQYILGPVSYTHLTLPTIGG